VSVDEPPETALHPSMRRFREEWESRGGTGEVRVLPSSAHTAALAAEALGCEVGAIANSLLFTAEPLPDEGREPDAAGPGPVHPVLLLTSGEHRVDLVATAARLGVARLRRADPELVREHTGQVIGGVSPFAHPAPLPTYLDPWLRRHPVLWAAAGHPAAVFSTTYAELAALTGAEEVDVTPAPTS
jgi:prolyl-tRNA editing enzyme YbaK/EbsC (Cys-tRNA(Pro) deacylase)